METLKPAIEKLSTDLTAVRTLVFPAGALKLTAHSPIAPCKHNSQSFSSSADQTDSGWREEAAGSAPRHPEGGTAVRSERGEKHQTWCNIHLTEG